MRVDTDDFARPCSCGRDHHIEVKEILIESGAVEKLEDMMSDGFLKEYISPLLICDTNTYEATKDIMESIYDRCQVLILEAEGLKADQHALDVIESYMDEDIDLILAVGAGTIHDLSRYEAFQWKIPFVSVPTAASVDGFVTTVAAMEFEGVKKTVKTCGPVCVIADTDIFSKAPSRLNAAGASDVLGKYICLTDWRIAHLVTGEYFCEETYKMEKRAVKTVKSCLKGIAQGDEESCEELMYALILSGLAMQMIGNSRPASSAEHHICHLWDMEVINGPVKALHGEKISVGLMLCLKEYKKIAHAIRRHHCKAIDYNGMDMDYLEEIFGQREEIWKTIIAENTPDPLEEITPERLEYCMEQIEEIIDELPDPEDMEELLDRGNCVKKMEDIGLSQTLIRKTLELSPYVRNRLSFMRIRKMLNLW